MTATVVSTGLQARAIQPWMVLVGLLLACALKGAWIAGGIEVPADADTIRDIGFIQGLLDGNLFGDPAVAGAWRWYPPLVHGMAALVLRVTGGEVMPVWIKAGAVLNLMTPVAFYFMNRALLGPWPAVLAVAVMVLFGGSVMAGDEAAGYTPWTLTPALVWPLFFMSVQMLHRHAPALRFATAVLLGCLFGLVFLAHTVPAVLLSGIAVAAVAASTGVTWRGAAWLAVVGIVEVLWALPFLGPLVLEYRLHIANPVPGAWVHGLLANEDGGLRLVMLNGPGVIAAVAVLAMGRASRLPVVSMAMLAGWIVLCIGFLARHFLCAGGEGGGACRVFVIAPHHFHVYLQAAWASVSGYALWVAYEGAGPRWHGAMRVGGGAVAAVGALFVLLNARDIELRVDARARPEQTLDRSAYGWITRHTAPGDRFVTLLPAALDQMGPAAATVLAAGRQLVAPPEIHANPYLPWAPMNARRQALLAAVGGHGMCRMERAGETWFMLPGGMLDGAAFVEAVFHTAGHTIYRRSAQACREMTASARF
jgi:hypothetical protein